MTTTNGELRVGLSFAEYCALPAMNSSTLKWADTSLAHLRAAIDGTLERSESDDMIFGRALHAALLEPEVFAEQYSISKGCSAILKSGDRKGDYCGKEARYGAGPKFYCGVHAGDEALNSCVLTQGEANRVMGAVASVQRHGVSRLLGLTGSCEVTALWQRDGIDCKARLDKLSHRKGDIPPIITDLKKVQVGRGGDWHTSKSIADYRYDFQAAWYVDGVAQILGDTPQFVWVFIEDGPPYAVNAVQADGETLDIGRRKVKAAWEGYMQALATGDWPGYDTNVHLGGLPEFARKRERDMMGGINQ